MTIDRKWMVLISLFLGTYIGPLNSSVTNIALPYIASYFDTTISNAGWVTMSFLLVATSLMLAYGRAGDIYGHRPVYLTGFIILIVASGLSGMAAALWQLVIFRGIQAVGAGMMMATVSAIVTETFPAAERGKALGLSSMTVAMGLATGPIIGGMLVAACGWRSVFLVNIPIGLIGFLWSWYSLPATSARKIQVFDTAGAITLFFALTSLLLFLSKGKQWGWTSGTGGLLLLSFLLMFSLFIIAERKSKAPMVDLNLFRDRLFSAANTSTFLNYIAQYSLVFLLPFYLERVRHMAPRDMGLLLTSFPLFYLIAAPISGAISDKVGTRIPAGLGMALTAAGLWGLSLLTPDTSFAYIALQLALIGIGTGTFQSPNNSAIMGCVPRSRLGLASSMLAGNRNLGMVMGVAISSAVFSSRYANFLGGGQDKGDAVAFVWAVNSAFMVAALAATAGIITSLVAGRDHDLDPAPATTDAGRP